MENLDPPQICNVSASNQDAEAAAAASETNWPVEHPWWAACLKLDADQPEPAWERLQTWERQGIPIDCVDQILTTDKTGINPVVDDPTRVPTEALNIQLRCFGTNLLDWQAHAWLQRCKLPTGFRLQTADDAITVGINFDPTEKWLNQPRQLLEAADFNSFWDPDPSRVALWRALGIPAVTLKNTNPSNGWLDQHEAARRATNTLGLPDPRSLSGPDAVLVLGSSEPGSVDGLQPPLYGWPGFDQIQISDSESARLLAYWLEHCSRLGVQIVRLRPTDEELDRAGFESLTIGNAPRQLPTQYFHGTLHCSVLQNELAWRRDGKPAPATIQTPKPKSSTIWESRNTGTSKACICISLYNYHEKIINALESAKAQSQEAIELIIVDDASTDQSLEMTLKWLQGNYRRFTRTLLLQHNQNSGLAATRNTGFQASNSDWIFVLDADNRLHVQAVEQCLQVAAYTNQEVAMVHPLIERIDEGGNQGGKTELISGQTWQQSQFLHSNYIDAMALVRKESWKVVGGYSHIEDGWEDYDFWCKLIDYGLQGVLCPQVLAYYVCHDQSMIANRTDRNVRRISRTLQARHPWLQLPMAKDDI